MINKLLNIKEINVWAIFFAIIMSSKTWGFIPVIPDTVLYGILFIYVIILCIGTSFFDPVMIILLIYIPINLLITDPPNLFKPWFRYGLFVLMSVCITSLLQSSKNRKFRLDVFKATMWLCVILGTTSFACYFLGINFMKIDSSHHIALQAGSFSGLINHSMMMGPIAGCGAIFMGNKSYLTKKRLYLILCLTCVGAVFLSASRSAVISTIVGIFFMLKKVAKSSNIFLRIITYVILIATLTFPLWQNVTNFVVEKQINNMQAGSSFSSREDKWTNRIEEFKSSPILGIGYVSVNINTDDVNLQYGTIEPGSSWLAVLSMTGIIGTVIILAIVFNSFKAIYNKQADLLPTITGIMCLLLTHMTAEGYIFSANSYLFFLLWLTLACARDFRFYKKENRPRDLKI